MMGNQSNYQPKLFKSTEQGHILNIKYCFLDFVLTHFSSRHFSVTFASSPFIDSPLVS